MNIKVAAFTVSEKSSFFFKYVHELLVNCLFKFTQDKVWLGELTVPPWP